MVNRNCLDNKSIEVNEKGMTFKRLHHSYVKIKSLSILLRVLGYVNTFW